MKKQAANETFFMVLSLYRGRPNHMLVIRPKPILITLILGAIAMVFALVVSAFNEPPAPSPALLKAQQDAQKITDEQKAAHDVNALRIASDFLAMRKAARNPDSFMIESALVMPGGAICYTYRAQNGFGGMNRGYAVNANGHLSISEDENSGFHKAWHKSCADKSGEEYIMK